MFGVAASALGLVLVSASMVNPALGAGLGSPVTLTLAPAVAAQSNPEYHQATAVRIADTSDIRRVAYNAAGDLDAASNLSTYQSLAVAVQAFQRPALEYTPPRSTLPPGSSLLTAAPPPPFPGHGALATNATGPWASPLYPQNGVMLWERIRVSAKQDRLAFLLGTAIQVHAPFAATTPGAWRGEGRHPGGAAPVSAERKAPTSPASSTSSVR